jgi:hypothetical protein
MYIVYGNLLEQLRKERELVIVNNGIILEISIMMFVLRTKKD